MIKMLLTFDVEPDLHSGGFVGVTEGIPRILAILDNYGIKATFFTTCDCIEEYPKIFQHLKKQGHEVALHGYRHVRFDDLSLEEKEMQIKKSVACFRKYLKETPRGFRSPQHSIDSQTLRILTKYGIKYDSSKTPLNLLQFLFFPKKIMLNLEGFFSSSQNYKIGKLVEIPPTSFFLPFVSLVPRAFPKFIQRTYFFLLKLFFKEIVFYAHSWDFIELPKSRIDRNFSHRRLIINFRDMIKYFHKKIEFKRMEDLL